MIDWKPVRIGDFLHRVKKPIKLSADENYNLVTVRMHHNGVILRESKQGKLIGSNMYRVKPGQFILSGIDARHGAFGIIPEELDGAVVTNDFWYFDIDENVVSRDFFLWLTTTQLFLDACIKSSEGTTNRRRLQSSKFFNFEFHFPDIHEQHRLAEHFIAFDTTYSNLKDEFDKQCDYFKQLRQAVLQEAIEGKLTADWRRQHLLVKGDPQYDAATLLAQIKTEKEQMVKDGKIRKEKPLPLIADSDKLFDLPKGWVWCMLGEIVLSAKDGPHFSPVYTDSGIPFVSTRNINPNGIDFSTAKQITCEYHEQISKRCKPELGDILYTKGGTTGIARVNTYDIEFNVWVHVAVLKHSKNTNSFYIQNSLNSPHCYVQAQKLTHGIGNQDLGLTRMVNITVPLPPLAEQQAIVARVNSLMATIDKLEKQVTERKEQAQRLMQAVLREAFGEGMI